MLIHKNIQGFRVASAPEIKQAIPAHHRDKESAYIIPDYPYGATLRCELRIWMDFDEKRGYRFCRQTYHPISLRENRAKKDTYMPLAGFMYVGQDDRIYVLGLSEYSGLEDIREFVQKYGEYLPADRLSRLQIQFGITPAAAPQTA